MQDTQQTERIVLQEGQKFICRAEFVSLEEEFKLVVAKMAVAGLQKMIEERSQKKAEMKEFVKEAWKQREHSMR